MEKYDSSISRRYRWSRGLTTIKLAGILLYHNATAAYRMPSSSFVAYSKVLLSPDAVKKIYNACQFYRRAYLMISRHIACIVTRVCFICYTYTHTYFTRETGYIMMHHIQRVLFTDRHAPCCHTSGFIDLNKHCIYAELVC